jgi:hypothetical protein
MRKTTTTGILIILGIVFIVLKLVNYLDWSWWFIFSPFFAVIGLCIFWEVKNSLFDYLDSLNIDEHK